MNTYNFAVILSGCGVYDGSEIHEAMLSLLAISKSGNQYQCYAPDIPQHHVINHLTGKEMPETRNVLIESARIARGKIKSLDQYNPAQFDALIIPGGYGAAKNLSSLAFDGPDFSVNSTFADAVIKTVKAQKPIGALCIAPAVISKIIQGAKVTIGDDNDTIEIIKKLGGHHEKAAVGQVIIDEKNLLVTTPCYMLNTTIAQIYEDVEHVLETIIKMLQEK